jgi:hypothetical protein
MRCDEGEYGILGSTDMEGSANKNIGTDHFPHEPQSHLFEFIPL